VRQDDRAPFDRALHRARVSAYPRGEFVGQESFMTATEIRALAVQAGIGTAVTVLDLCCGTAGPGALLTRELGCDYLGVDASASALAIARQRARDLPCRFAIAQVPPLPAGSFDVVLLLETMLAFDDKAALVREITAALRPGGRFAFTLEEGSPLATAERAAMPDADTVSLTPLDDMVASLERAGLVVTWQEDHSRAHRATAQALAGAFAADGEAIAAQIGRRGLDELLAAHRLWIKWLDEGRVRKLALVAERALGRADGETRLGAPGGTTDQPRARSVLTLRLGRAPTLDAHHEVVERQPLADAVRAVQDHDAGAERLDPHAVVEEPLVLPPVGHAPPVRDPQLRAGVDLDAARLHDGRGAVHPQADRRRLVLLHAQQPSIAAATPDFRVPEPQRQPLDTRRCGAEPLDTDHVALGEGGPVHRVHQLPVELHRLEVDVREPLHHGRPHQQHPGWRWGCTFAWSHGQRSREPAAAVR
jgi:SAM-dependent methyltransferase